MLFPADFSLKIRFLSPAAPERPCLQSLLLGRSMSQKRIFSLFLCPWAAQPRDLWWDVPSDVTSGGLAVAPARLSTAVGREASLLPSSIRRHHIPHSFLLWFLLKSPHLSLASTFVTSNLFPHGRFCFITTTCLHFLGCSVLSTVFMQLVKKKKKKQNNKCLHLCLSDSYFSIWSFLQKFPVRTVLLLLRYIFILPFYKQWNAGPPTLPPAPYHLFSPPANASFHF